ncbi:MAG TPA: type II toxin-antitoxin system RelE/ParE family toxin [Gaiellaceae bacterium]|nr:type II toxin-antitoxin system RelE/ParE family toxin [Gaiellaceae bacterium]
MPELRLTRQAKEQLQALPNGVREAVLDTLALIQLEPEAMGKKLVGRMKGLWAARVGSYRVLYTVEPAGVIVRSIRHRSVVYRPRRRRR